MGVYGAKKVTVEMANEVWENHEKGRKPIAIAVMLNCCEATVKRIIRIGETARKQPEKLADVYPDQYTKVKAAAKERYAPRYEEDTHNSTTYLVAVLKQLNETNNYLNAICKALDIKK